MIFDTLNSVKVITRTPGEKRDGLFNICNTLTTAN